jgi:hypothetical protein
MTTDHLSADVDAFADDESFADDVERRGWPRVAALAVFTLAAALTPISEQRAATADCPGSSPRAASPDDPDDLVEAALGGFPAVNWSPGESVASHDAVFLADVAVPARPCSLGWCAGLRVVDTHKGTPGKTVLVKITGTGDAARDAACGAPYFREKDGRWVVFARRGTSPGGQAYVQVDADGPSYASKTLPDFARLERSYRNLRAQLDQAISERMGRAR